MIEDRKKEGKKKGNTLHLQIVFVNCSFKRLPDVFLYYNKFMMSVLY